jgi:putative PIN family toxin of toxin-antitoxin system
VRAVLDPNVLIAALLSRTGAAASVVSRWLTGAFELVVSEKLLEELTRALAYPKLRARISAEEAADFVELLRSGAVFGSDPPTGTHRSLDSDDDYLLALAEAQRAVLVSGDRHLLQLAPALPIYTARAFLDTLGT